MAHHESFESHQLIIQIMFIYKFYDFTYEGEVYQSLSLLY